MGTMGRQQSREGKATWVREGGKEEGGREREREMWETEQEES